ELELDRRAARVLERERHGARREVLEQERALRARGRTQLAALDARGDVQRVARIWRRARAVQDDLHAGERLTVRVDHDAGEHGFAREDEGAEVERGGTRLVRIEVQLDELVREARGLDQQ